MMGRMMAFIVVVVCSAQVVLLRAQEPSLDLADKRFTYHQVDDGYLRLDLRTGEVATCRQREGAWICALVPEERAALESEIARLRRDNALLKNALLERGLPLPASESDIAALGASTPPHPPATVPNEPDLAQRNKAEVDRVMDVMERLWHRLVELMASIQRDIQKKG